MTRVVLMAGLLFSGVVLAQANPDEEWGSLPVDSNAPKPLPPPTPVSRTPSAAASAPRLGIEGDPRPPVEPNTVSMFAGPTLGQWKRGQAVYVGFPALGLRLAIGLLERLDFAVGFETFYGVMNEFHVGVKFGLLRGAHWNLSLAGDCMLALFSQRAAKEQKGPRWITGHRNYGANPGLIVSYQGESPRAARLFADLRYLIAFDTDPFAKDPLNGVPANLVIGHNVTLRFGAELPLSARTSFMFMLGIDFHGRDADAVVMPVAMLGLVTGL